MSNAANIRNLEVARDVASRTYDLAVKRWRASPLQEREEAMHAARRAEDAADLAYVRAKSAPYAIRTS
jgi:hypothetical protein